MITFRQKGDFKKTTQYLNRLKRSEYMKVLTKYGEEGVAALSSDTPIDSGLTAGSWHHKIEIGKGSSSISFYNSNVNKGVQIAIILQYGHGTGTGGWVEGRDYINPAIQPIFDRMADEVWKEVTKI